MQFFPHPFQSEGLNLFSFVNQKVVDPLVKFDIGVTPTEKLHLRQQIRFLIEQHAIRGQSVASGATNLLVPGFHGTGNFRMNDESDIRLVDSHSECGCRQDERTITAHELVLNPPPLVLFQIAVITDMGDPPGTKLIAETFERSNQGEVHDPAS